MKTNKIFSSGIESLDVYEAEDDGFTEGKIKLGKTVAAFNFGGSIEKPKPVLENPAAPLAPGIFRFTASQRGLTPAIDGEAFSVKRGYQFRPSTLRKLSELKTKHADINVYLNTILDEAINFYYEHISGEKSN